MHKWFVLEKIPLGQPIGSDCSRDSYQMSELMDHFIKPLSNRHRTYIKDTWDLTFHASTCLHGIWFQFPYESLLHSWRNHNWIAPHDNIFIILLAWMKIRVCSSTHTCCCQNCPRMASPHWWAIWERETGQNELSISIRKWNISSFFFTHYF